MGEITGMAYFHMQLTGINLHNLMVYYGATELQLLCMPNLYIHMIMNSQLVYIHIAINTFSPKPH